jgi:hypothetical protein
MGAKRGPILLREDHTLKAFKKGAVLVSTKQQYDIFVVAP